MRESGGMEKVDEYPQLYPNLEPPLDFRLQEISRLREELKKEIETRVALRKKYKRAITGLNGVDIGATALGVALGGIGTGLLATLFAAPVVPIIMGVAAGCGLVSAGTKFTTRRLQPKVQKHDQIRVLAETKLDSVSDLVSKALIDGAVHHAEFQLILNEVGRYHTLKRDIRERRKKRLPELNEATKKELVARGREEARNSMLAKIGAGSSP